MTNHWRDIQHADLVFINGGNPAEAHPVGFRWLMKAKRNGGKIIHVDEMSGPGHRHELAGERLLIAQGISEKVARFCVTHAAWDDSDRTVEDLLVALADKLWKGKREEGLERSRT